jgi:hypothetical protein
MRNLILALAATTLLGAPAAVAQSGNGNGNAYGQGPRVCLVTFADGSNTLASNVIKAQYLPLGVALNHKARVMNDYQLIITYGTSGATGTGIDYSRINAGGFDLANTFNATTTTQVACEFLADYAESRDMDDDDDNDD